MNEQKIVSQMRRGFLEFCVLSIIARGEIYSSELLLTLKEAQMIVSEGTIYPLMSRLSKAGYVSHRWEESESGPPRKYFSLTPRGSKFLDDLQSAWDGLVTAVEQIRTQPTPSN